MERVEREKFVGAWNLVSYEARSDDGRVVQPYGPSPYGRLMYDADGYMSVLLMASGRDKFESDNPSRSTPDEAKAAFDAFMASYETRFHALSQTFWLTSRWRIHD